MSESDMREYVLVENEPTVEEGIENLDERLEKFKILYTHAQNVLTQIRDRQVKVTTAAQHYQRQREDCYQQRQHELATQAFQDSKHHHRNLRHASQRDLWKLILPRKLSFIKPRQAMPSPDASSLLHTRQQQCGRQEGRAIFTAESHITR